MPQKKTPSERCLEKQAKVLTEQQKMKENLAKFGRKVPAGRMWTLGDMQKFFKSGEKEKK